MPVIVFKRMILFFPRKASFPLSGSYGEEVITTLQLGIKIGRGWTAALVSVYPKFQMT